MDDVIELEVAGVTTVIQHSGGLRLNDLLVRLGSFRPRVIPPDAFRVKVTVLHCAGTLPFRGFAFDGKDRVVFDQAGLRGHIDLAGGTAAIDCVSEDAGPTIDYFLRVLYSLLIFEKGGLMVHAAGIVRHGAGYLFMGPSGSGKTTVSSLSPDAVVLNDDLVALRPVGGAWTMWSTPFSGPGQMLPSPGKAPLGQMIRLVQASEHKLERLAPALAVAELAASCPVIPADPSRGKVLLDRLRRLLEHHRLDRLHFSRDAGFWAVLDEDLAGSA